MTRRGFTLVEVLLVAFLSVVVVGCAWFVFLSGTRQSEKLDRQMDRVQALLLLLEDLSDDVGQAVVVPGDGEEGNRSGGRELKLYRFKSYRAAPGALRAGDEEAYAVRSEAVAYRFDAATRALVRNGRALPFGRFEDVKFYLPDPSTPGVKVSILDASGGSSDAYTFLLPLPARSQEAAFESWRENYPDMVPGVEF